MNRLESMSMLVAVIDAGSMSAAARQLGIAPGKGRAAAS